MIGAADLAKAFARNTAVVTMQVAGLSHEESLLQTPYRINCLNWTLGHLLLYRDRVLRNAGGRPQFADGELARYERESDPITADGPGVIPLSRLVSALETSQTALAEALGTMTDEQFSAETEIDGRLVKLSSQLHFDYFHDTYHTGHTEILRQVAGKTDKII